MEISLIMGAYATPSAMPRALLCSYVFLFILEKVSETPDHC